MLCERPLFRSGLKSKVYTKVCSAPLAILPRRVNHAHARHPRTPADRRNRIRPSSALRSGAPYVGSTARKRRAFRHFILGIEDRTHKRDNVNRRSVTAKMCLSQTHPRRSVTAKMCLSSKCDRPKLKLQPRCACHQNVTVPNSSCALSQTQVQTQVVPCHKLRFKLKLCLSQTHPPSVAARAMTLLR